MSFMKKLVGLKSVSDPARQSHVQDNALGLMHLRKLFAEFRHPAPKATQKDQEDKLYTMLPLFCKVRVQYSQFYYYVIQCVMIYDQYHEELIQNKLFRVIAINY